MNLDLEDVRKLKVLGVKKASFVDNRIVEVEFFPSTQLDMSHLDKLGKEVVSELVDQDNDPEASYWSSL